jgi:hypothetical protein
LASVAIKSFGQSLSFSPRGPRGYLISSQLPQETLATGERKHAESDYILGGFLDHGGCIETTAISSAIRIKSVTLTEIPSSAEECLGFSGVFSYGTPDIPAPDKFYHFVIPWSEAGSPARAVKCDRSRGAFGISKA